LKTQIKKILIVESEEKDFLALRKILKNLFSGIRLSRARTFAEALKASEKRYFDLYLVTDSVSGRSGIELIRGLVKQETDIPIIYLCGEDDDAQGFGAIRAGASEFFIKGKHHESYLKHVIWTSLERSIRDRNIRPDYSRTQTLSNSAIEGIAITDPVNIFHANEAFCSLFGYSLQQVVGFSIWRFISEDIKASIGENILLKSERFCEAVGIHKNCSRFPIEISCEIKHLSGKKCRVYIVRDYRESKMMKTALQKKSRYLNALIENGSELIVVLDRNGLIKYSSPSINRILEYSEGELIDANVFDFIHQDDFRGLVEIFKEGKCNQNRFQSVEFRIRHKNGSWRYLEAHGTNLLKDPDIQGIVINSQDVNRRKQTEKALMRNKARMDLMTKETNDGIWDWDIETDTLFWSERMNELIGTQSGTVVRSWRDLEKFMHNEDRELFQNSLWNHLNSNEPFNLEVRFLKANGEFGNFIIRGDALRNGAGKPLYMAGSITDITARKNAEARIRHTALYDELTKLPNRELLLHRMSVSIKRSKREKDYQFAVLLMNIDRFNNINSSLGHRHGDTLLIEFSRRVSSCLGPLDALARLGSDEFVLLLDNCSMNEALKTSQKIRKKMFDPFKLRRKDIYITISIGIVMGSSLYKAPEELLRDAGTAMERAKKKGEPKYELFNSAMYDRAVKRLQVETDLRRALERKEFELYYQPIVSLSSGRVTGFESLIRWNHPERGLLLPEDFIPVAEETGIIVPMGEWVLHQACRQNRKWQESGMGPLRISVNFSVKQFQNCNVLSLIKEALSKSGMEPAHLDVEITESTTMLTHSISTAILNELSDLGVNICIDDFGTGYSSLGRLKHISNYTLKIDRSFICGLFKDEKDIAIVSAIIALAKNLKLKMIAEGVETREQMSFLQSKKCDEAQGFVFSRPLPENKLKKLFKRSKDKIIYSMDGD